MTTVKLTERQIRKIIMSEIVGGVHTSASVLVDWASILKSLSRGEKSRIRTVLSEKLASWNEKWNSEEFQQKIDLVAAASIAGGAAAAQIALRCPACSTAAVPASSTLYALGAVSSTLSIAHSLGFGTTEGNFLKDGLSKGELSAAFKDIYGDIANISHAAKKIGLTDLAFQRLDDQALAAADEAVAQIISNASDAPFSRGHALSVMCKLTADGEILQFEDAKAFLVEQVETHINGLVDTTGLGADLRDAYIGQLQMINELTPEDCSEPGEEDEETSVSESASRSRKVCLTNQQMRQIVQKTLRETAAKDLALEDRRIGWQDWYADYEEPRNWIYNEIRRLWSEMPESEEQPAPDLTTINSWDWGSVQQSACDTLGDKAHKRVYKFIKDVEDGTYDQDPMLGSNSELLDKFKQSVQRCG